MAQSGDFWVEFVGDVRSVGERFECQEEALHCVGEVFVLEEVGVGVGFGGLFED